jgi:hypothetical protein
MMMVDEVRSQPEIQQARRPRSITWIVVMLWFQVLANAFGGWLLLTLAQEDKEHGREVPGVIYVIAYASLLAAVLLAVCAVVLIRSRLGWPRYTVILIEWLLIASWFVALFTAEGGRRGGHPTGDSHHRRDPARQEGTGGLVRRLAASALRMSGPVTS